MSDLIYPELPAEEAIFFTGKPEELALYECFRSRLLAEVGEAHIKVSRTQITFSGKYGFAFVSHPRRKKERGILLSCGLFHRQQSNRIQYASEPYPNRWTHHMLVQRQEEIDEELIDWLKEAYWFANTKKSGSRRNMKDIEKSVQSRLFALQDLKYRDFNCKLIPNVPPETVIGIRTPELRKFAKAYAKEPDAAEFLKILPHKYYDENNLHGFLISYIKE